MGTAATGRSVPRTDDANQARPGQPPRLLSVTPATINVSGALGVRPIRRATGTAARALALPGVVGVLLALFLLVQNRIDARDPRLAVAPLEADDDTVGFA